ncbi:MAG: hypothetical protein ACLPPF_02340 [Rhodomicrobium sp.]
MTTAALLHCEPRPGGQGKLSEAIHGFVTDAALDRHGVKGRLAMTNKRTLR